MQKEKVILRVLLNKFHPNITENAFKVLPEEDRDLLTVNVFSSNPALIFTEQDEFIKIMHYSWLIPIFESFSEDLKPKMLSFLSEKQKMKLSKILNISEDIESSSFVKDFLFKLLREKINLPLLLPVEFLPKSSLHPLSNLNKENLVELIDLLALYDLSEEIRNLIDKKSLERIYNCLTMKKKQFLRLCMQQKEKIAVTKLKLEQWDGDCISLEKMLHQRGLLRLGKALSGQHESFIWRIVHTLDVGRGASLEKYASQSVPPKVLSILLQQVINGMNFLTKEKDKG